MNEYSLEHLVSGQMFCPARVAVNERLENHSTVYDVSVAARHTLNNLQRSGARRSGLTISYGEPQEWLQQWKRRGGL